METNQILRADVLDIIFEGRNKMYGAYELRKSYNKRLKSSILVMIGCCLFAFLAAFTGKKENHHSATLIVDGDVTLQTEPQQPLVPPPPPPPPPPSQPKPIASIKFTTPVLTNENIETPPPAQIDMDNIAIGKIDNPNGEHTDMIAPPVEEKGIGNVVAPQVDDLKNEVFFVQKEAQFPGGANAWIKYLERTLRVDLPAENGAPAGTYSVVVSFLVDKDGNVSEVQALNNPGYGTADEAVRAIKKGPQWIPAVQNGRNVIYRQKQTITFRVEEAQ
ncbi:energy transducer TonB [Ilyomonas limi]|uniref:Energy transducer TonB n=1 Tax=Ilyomonas limi TaxID=2575867 RepID=A0A4U3L310_9BACT|nr:energy transducer TonB [Ilyomonas limi]TKK68644.1 energy transducer TonB [Ilyomonas limi]